MINGKKLTSKVNSGLLEKFFFSLFFVIFCLPSCNHPVIEEKKTNPKPQFYIVYHEKLIEGLRAQCNFEDKIEIFKIIFEGLDGDVFLFPTENHYYFELNCGGENIRGNLQLDTVDRDMGVLHFVYYRPKEIGQQTQYLALNEKAGVEVEKINQEKYRVTFLGKEVLFNLNYLSKNNCIKMDQQEIFLGRIFDESGLEFSLVFDTSINKFLYYFCEDSLVKHHFKNIAPGIFFEIRTEFVFARDEKTERYILVGVHAPQVFSNSYFDGPFDQVPDNIAEQTEIRKYLEIAYPEYVGKIDAFGNFIENPEERVVIEAEKTYRSFNEFFGLSECFEQDKKTDRACILQFLENIR